MSTSETDEFELGACPCGAGKIIKSVTTQDNPWSGADISYWIRCPACSVEWRIESGSLVKVASERPYEAAIKVASRAHDAVKLIADRLVAGYFATFGAKTKKAEHAEAVRLGIFKHDYRSYLRSRANAATPAGACHALANTAWVKKLANGAGTLGEFETALAEQQRTRQLVDEAGRKIVRKPMPAG